MIKPNTIFNNDLTIKFEKQISWVQFCFQVGKPLMKWC